MTRRRIIILTILLLTLAVSGFIATQYRDDPYYDPILTVECQIMELLDKCGLPMPGFLEDDIIDRTLERERNLNVEITIDAL